MCRTYVHLSFLMSNTIADLASYRIKVDVWSGEDDSPVITHGRTFTSKISARDALLAISQYGFLASSYPLILSLEIHCDFIQQGKLVEILKETLGERLVVQRIDGSEGELEKLPSPFELRGRVLVKVRLFFGMIIARVCLS